MCGIAGFIDFKKQTSKEILVGMTDALVHRGPDDAGYEIYDAGSAEVGFGQRRLSIMDLSPLGHQPMHFEYLTANFNGEIYNFKEIRAELEQKGYQFASWSDTEVILKGYHYWGMKVIDKFIGMFAIVLFDRKQNKVLFMRDRAGIKPLYIYHKDALYLFGSELKALMVHPNFKKEIDTNSLALFLQYSYIPAPYSIFKGTTKLLPGHWMELDLSTQESRLHKYWDVFDYYNLPKLKISDGEAIERTDALMKSAYEYRMVADVPVGLFLSGGYDSSSVAALLQTGRTEKIRSYTIGFHESSYNEAPEAKKIAEYLGTEHTEWYLSAQEAKEALKKLPELYDEPFADNSTVPTYLVSLLARKEVTVALSADGGDEIFGGYNKFNLAEKFTKQLPAPMQQILSGAMKWVNPDAIPYFREKYNFATRYEKMQRIWQHQDPFIALKMIAQYITTSEVKRFMKNEFEDYTTAFDEGKKLTNHPTDGVINRLMAIDYKTFLVDNNLVKVDRATMSVGLEGREPMLDHRLIEFLAQLPSHFKVRDGVNKWLLKQVVHRYIPKELMERPKKPFIAPLTVWFKEELQAQLLHYLGENALQATGAFHVPEIIKVRDAYLSGKKVNYQKLWNVLMFQLWYNKWVKEI
jgi:asparagine synthase (glutamine-hydrolysing)